MISHRGGFNEAALLRVRKGSALDSVASRTPSFNEAALLRVRKDSMSVRGCVACRSSFNEAALLRVRKAH